MGLIKIGVTIDINDRLKTLQVGSPDQLELVGAIASPRAHWLEIDLHIRFQEARSHGEWFRPVDELLEIIEQHSLDRHAKSTKDDLRAALKLTYRAA